MKHIIIACALLLPIYANAAWYNPFSWFKPVVHVVSTTTPPKTLTPKVEIKTIERPVEKIIEKKIVEFVDNPKTLAFVKELSDENVALKNNIKELSSIVYEQNDKLNSYIETINYLKSNINAQQAQSIPQNMQTTSKIEINAPYIKYPQGANKTISKTEDVSDITVAVANESRQVDDPTIILNIRVYENDSVNSSVSDKPTIVTTDINGGFFVYGLQGDIQTFNQYIVSKTDSTDSKGNFFSIGLTPKVTGTYNLVVKSDYLNINKIITINVI